MKNIFVILMTALLICFGAAQTGAESDPQKDAVAAAQTWLALIDNGNYAASWKEASAYFRGAVSEQNWTASLTGVRKPLGKLVGRKIAKTLQVNNLPGAPDGKYVVMSFKTGYEKKKSATETVTFMLDEDNKWRAAGYFIK